MTKNTNDTITETNKTKTYKSISYFIFMSLRIHTELYLEALFTLYP